jgi:2-dehydro-3-deoxygalactonokinase
MVCLPGTHSKWAVVEYGKIARFSTYMTGETFAVLKSHSLLGRMMKGGDDPAAFLDGVKRSGDAGTLLNHIFSVRTRGLFGELKDESAAAYLSGILIGHEIRSHGWERIFLIGAPELTALYEQAAFALDVQTETLDPQAAARALFALAKEAKPS